jgi:hypothetical protein
MRPVLRRQQRRPVGSIPSRATAVPSQADRRVDAPSIESWGTATRLVMQRSASITAPFRRP